MIVINHTPPALDKLAVKLKPIGLPIISHNDIPVYRASHLDYYVGVIDGLVVFYIQVSDARLNILGKPRIVKQIRKAWRNHSIPSTKYFLLTLYIPCILDPYGISCSANQYTDRARLLSFKIIDLVPYAYNWNQGALSVIHNWQDCDKIIFSKDRLI